MSFTAQNSLPVQRTLTKGRKTIVLKPAWEAPPKWPGHPRNVERWMLWHHRSTLPRKKINIQAPSQSLALWEEHHTLSCLGSVDGRWRECPHYHQTGLRRDLVKEAKHIGTRLQVIAMQPPADSGSSLPWQNSAMPLIWTSLTIFLQRKKRTASWEGVGGRRDSNREHVRKVNDYFYWRRYLVSNQLPQKLLWERFCTLECIKSR